MKKLSPWAVIQSLEADGSRLAKEAILAQQMLVSNDELFQGIQLALDSLITFGVKKVPESNGGGAGFTWQEFLALSKSLAERKLTGNAAIAAIEFAKNAATAEQWDNWYRRILIKDLRCGVSDKTVNNVAKKYKRKDYVVPVFSCQLAHDSANHEGKVTGEKLVEVKLDGVRVLTIVWPDGRVNQYSRNGKELMNFAHVKAKFAAVAAELDQAYVFDGEIMSSSFQDLMRQVHRKSNVSAGDAVLHLFDMIPLRDFQRGKYQLSQILRSEKLRNWFEDKVFLKLVNVQILNQELVNLDTAEGQQRYKEINRAAIAGGYEGIMLKDPDAPYECKRSTAWLKLKPFIEVTLEVIGFEEGTGKNVGRLGALVGRGQEDGRLITVNVGSGYSDALRDDIWANRNNVTGQMFEARADAVTQAQNGEYSLRFPRFLRFRGFAKGEKL